MNVIIVVIDTLRYDHVGANGNESISTPNLDRRAAESWCFDRCFVTSFPTIPHRLDVITGRSGSPFHPWAPLQRHLHAALLRPVLIKPHMLFCWKEPIKVGLRVPQHPVPVDCPR